MGEVKVEVELGNYVDRELSNRGYIKAEQIRSIMARVVADTGAVMLVLPQDMVEALGLRLNGTVIVSPSAARETYADERKEERPLARGVTVRVGKREALASCVVGPPLSEPLLGQVILEQMDLLVDCAEQKLVPRPESPFLPTLKLK